jgi:L-amino acid N-acyltransferase YncA
MTCTIRDSREGDMAEVVAIYAHHVGRGTTGFTDGRGMAPMC